MIAIARRPKAPLVVAIALALCAGCAGNSDPSTPPECPQTVTVTVSGSPAPVIGWTPVCRALEIVVDPGTDLVSYWALRAVGDTNALLPPVVYGAAPNGTVTLQDPLLLQSGQTYRATVYRFTRDTTVPSTEAIGAALFVP